MVMFGRRLRGRLDALCSSTALRVLASQGKQQLADQIGEKSEESRDPRPRDVNEARDAVASSGLQSEREAARESCEVHSRIPAPAVEALIETEAAKKATEERAPGSPNVVNASSEGENLRLCLVKPVNSGALAACNVFFEFLENADLHHVYFLWLSHVGTNATREGACVRVGDENGEGEEDTGRESEEGPERK
ncbi:hypothetical protein EVAR_32215_1 [Eumeta japonica]|uniref:Uncharacterized protein n=1 Tax=Eumeta variegata TaxID=151549 RepID=A0A4C1VZH2_EUMVA|nr:hypothetical protein EVAR_32215_1 [Eumeta japonica]